MKVFYIGSAILCFTLFNYVCAKVCDGLESIRATDECYMKIALNFGLTHNPKAPFGTLIVDHATNEISCYGVNSNKKNTLLHGETAAFWNCTELYPSPTDNDMINPGLNWSIQTLYTTGEPCPMCASQAIYRGVHRVVWGSTVEDVNYSGCPQLMMNMVDVLATSKLGANRPNPKAPILEGGILKDDCDHAFWCAFSSFRGKSYYEAMKKEGLEDFVKDRRARFSCDGEPKMQYYRI
ncbi:hypothetical protein HPULCUR_002574 [Helicostylum pulchrum]|uniref:CMP/dCMP-type deaminase domain-containing protein n=1 Tax=Helicostylum pulchrum TaxID=562976 RepID=A0ABP9XSC3_9FUNG